MHVEIIGPGCPRCKKVERNVNRAADQLAEGPESISKVEDDMEIIERGVMHTPAVAIDGEIVIEGEVPDVEELTELLAAT
ncbi:MAG: thioredoxin family protein [Halobacteriota archaeon]|uniref:thioredoxin family protein n=1 Tax=Halodesulfurarchaeum sp. HSR-GB TaxID=3074077 RepID=UPI002855917B|nr:thioredoxin family protein [Halodesulfurarchaeum sp. HSR-GB]MDR5656605.1 thioredoxin family protein [Halodesulfurarchaeum sp. HSR-GB]